MCSVTSVMSDSVILWTVAHQTPGFSRQEILSRLPCSPPWDLPDPGTEPVSLSLQAEYLLLSHWGKSLKRSIASVTFLGTKKGETAGVNRELDQVICLRMSKNLNRKHR